MSIYALLHKGFANLVIRFETFECPAEAEKRKTRVNVEHGSAKWAIFGKSAEFCPNSFVYWSCVLGFGTLVGAI